jgi:hypothetical protein
MRHRIARALRKWADLVDPRTEPSDVLSIRIEVNTEEALASIQRVRDAAVELAEYGVKGLSLATHSAPEHRPGAMDAEEEKVFGAMYNEYGLKGAYPPMPLNFPPAPKPPQRATKPA